MKTILGINAYHGDSAAALLIDGKLVAAAEEERFRRIKHWAGLPSEAVRWCLADAGLNLADVDGIAINTDANAALGKKIQFALTNRLSPSRILPRLKNRNKRQSIGDALSAELKSPFHGKLIPVEHHRAHLASAFFQSDFDEAAVLSIDGFGDFASSAWGLGRSNKITIDGRVHFPHSLGLFYTAITQLLGFPHYGDEYKVMGLAPYGQPSFMEEMRQIVHIKDDGQYRLNLDYFCHHTDEFKYAWENGVPSIGHVFTPALESLLGKARKPELPLTQRHYDLARSAQSMYEEALFSMLCKLHQRHPSDNLALAGGCAMNSVANGKIAMNTPFKNLYVQSAAGDAGGAIGAACSVWHSFGAKRQPGVHHAYWGPKTSKSEISKLLSNHQTDLAGANCSITHYEDEQALCEAVAAEIADGKVIGWFQGRMEWGPRALGNRSILGDPRRSDMKEILNLKIKRRESFRPFAPSVLEEAASDWFEQDGPVPFMMQVFQIKPEQREKIPAVTHVDGSGRLQTVSGQSNPRYHRLISCFAEQTGVPMLLNTSFNENEPVVCRPIEALNCYLRTKMDVLVLGDHVVRRNEQPAHE